jgi:hypothetical protein
MTHDEDLIPGSVYQSLIRTPAIWGTIDHTLTILQVGQEALYRTGAHLFRVTRPEEGRRVIEVIDEVLWSDLEESDATPPE